MEKLLKVTEILDTNKNVKSARFVSINGYENKNGEISNYVINLNVSLEKLKERDINLLQSLELDGVSETARQELLDSFIKNRSKETATNQSKGQIDAYTHLSKNIKFHNTTREVFITGMLVQKYIIKKGTYKEVKSAEKTIAKNKIKKHLRSAKYRTFATGLFV